VSAAPTIGITMSLDPGTKIRPGHDYLYVGRSYARSVRAAGGVPLLVPPDAEPGDALRLCDGFVISGGGLLPARLGAREPHAEREAQERVDWDRRLIDGALAQRRPLLGVCYGMQLLNLHLGGTLLAELPAGAVDHGGSGRIAEHPVAVEPRSALFSLLGGSARVASSHRQALAAVAPGLRVTATAADAVVEAVEADGALGVEWHPELDATGCAIYGDLVRRARERT
jgi:putative glutamine amidotransferase